MIIVVNKYVYNMSRQSHLLVQQIQKKLDTFEDAEKILPPPNGWINAIRKTLNMTMSQLGRKLKMTRQGVSRIEISEKTGSISIKSLKDVAQAMDLKLVYGFVPKDGSIENLIDRKALELAQRIVRRTNHTMKLEDQAIGEAQIQESINELAADFKRELNKSLWD